jgi:hypothetical protein
MQLTTKCAESRQEQAASDRAILAEGQNAGTNKAGSDAEDADNLKHLGHLEQVCTDSKETFKNIK